MCGVAAGTQGTVVLRCLAAGILAVGGARDLTRDSYGVLRAEKANQSATFFSRYSGYGCVGLRLAGMLGP